MTGDGIECQHMTTCKDRPCFQGAQCFDDEAQGFRCGPCPVGYKGNGVTCSPAIRCSDNPCFAGVTCANHNEPPGYRCGACPQGMTGNGITCEDIDECQYRPCNPQSQCINLVPGFRCGPCPVGYTGRQIQGVGLDFARANRQVLQGLLQEKFDINCFLAMSGCKWVRWRKEWRVCWKFPVHKHSGLVHLWRMHWGICRQSNSWLSSTSRHMSWWNHLWWKCRMHYQTGIFTISVHLQNRICWRWTYLWFGLRFGWMARSKLKMFWSTMCCGSSQHNA